MFSFRQCVSIQTLWTGTVFSRICYYNDTAINIWDKLWENVSYDWKAINTSRRWQSALFRNFTIKYSLVVKVEVRFHRVRYLIFRLIKIKRRQIDAENISVCKIHTVIEVCWCCNGLILRGPLACIIGSLLVNNMMHGIFRQICAQFVLASCFGWVCIDFTSIFQGYFIIIDIYQVPAELP